MLRCVDTAYCNLLRLSEWGYPFPSEDDGRLYIANLRGPDYMRFMRRRVLTAGVTVLDHHPALELLSDGDAIVGAAGVARGIIGVPAIALKKGSGFHRQRLMQNIAFDMAGGGQQHLAGADAAHHLAAHRDVLGQNLAVNLGLVADHQAHAADIAFDPSIDLNVAGRGYGAVDHHVGADDGGGGQRAGALGRGRRRGGHHRLRGGSIVFASVREHGGQPR